MINYILQHLEGLSFYFNLGLVLLNAVISAVIVVRVLTYERKGAPYCRVYSCLATVIVVSYAYFPLELVTGSHVDVDDFQVVINLVVMASLIRLKGNVAGLFKRPGVQN